MFHTHSEEAIKRLTLCVELAPGGVVLAAGDDEVVAPLGLEVFDDDLLKEHGYVPMDLDFTKGQGMILTSTIRRLRILLHQD